MTDMRTIVEVAVLRRVQLRGGKDMDKKLASTRRKLSIWRSYVSGEGTYAEIGKCHGISGERCRQIVAEVERAARRAVV